MATWIAHLRIADNLLKSGFELALAPFLLGNIAPDAGYMNENGDWQPSKNITHCLDSYRRVQPEDFYDSYLRDQSYTAETYAFVVGCYAHLLADVEWIGNVWRPLQHDEPQLTARIDNDAEFGYDFKRMEYFGHDFLFLHENPDFSAWQLLQQIETVPYSIDLLPSQMIMDWLKRDVITTYADKATLARVLKHDFPYLDRFSMQVWLDCTTTTLVEMLKGKGVPCPNPHPLWGGYIQPYA